MKNMFKIWWQNPLHRISILIAGLAVIAMTITTHKDLIYSTVAEKFLETGNPWDAIANDPNCQILSLAPYPPLFYGLQALYLWFLTKLHLVASSAFTCDAIFNPGPWVTFLIKLPNLILLFGGAWIIGHMKHISSVIKKRASLLWLSFAPLFFVSFLFGQIDIWIGVCFLAMLWAILEEKPYLAVFFLGVGGAFKHAPFFLVPFLVCILGQKSLRRMIGLTLVAFVPYILTIVPFLKSAAFRATVFGFSENQRIFSMGFVPDTGHLAILFVIIYALSFFAVMRKTPSLQPEEQWRRVIQSGFWIMSLVLMTTFWHPQWIVWMVPFVIFMGAMNETIEKYMVLLSGLFFAYTLFTFSTEFEHNFFQPLLNFIAPHTAPVPILATKINTALLGNISYSLIIAVLLWIGYVWTKDNVAGAELKDAKPWPLVLRHLAPVGLYVATVLTITIVFSPPSVLTGAERAQGGYVFLEHYSDASTVFTIPQPGMQTFFTFPAAKTVNGMTKSILFMHPYDPEDAPGEVIFSDITVPQSATLEFAIATMENTWNEPGDGVHFFIDLASEGTTQRIFDKTIDPKHNNTERLWLDESVNLAQWSGKRVNVTFGTQAGDTNTYDSAGFGDPVIRP